MECEAAWDDSNNSCDPSTKQLTCDQVFLDTSDAICKCSGGQQDNRNPPPPPPPPAVNSISWKSSPPPANGPANAITSERIAIVSSVVNSQLGLSKSTNFAECEGPCGAKLVRFAFHVCVGGCNGCLNFKLSDNNGLAGIAQLLESIYDDPKFGPISGLLSHADFYVLAANEAVKQSSLKSQKKERKTIEIPFDWGRPDCSTAPQESRNLAFPSGAKGLSEVRTHIAQKMGMTDDEAIALMGGAHSLGGTRAANSGHAFAWSPPTDGLDNTYFEGLQLGTYSSMQQTANGISWILTNNKDLGMLNSDMALWGDLDGKLDSIGRLDFCTTRNPSACKSTSLKASPTRPTVKTFAGSYDTWVDTFKRGWKKMHLTGEGGAGTLRVMAPCSRTSTNCPKWTYDL